MAKIIEELRAQSDEELEAALEDRLKELFSLHNEVRETKKGVEKPHLFNEKRKTIARIHTILAERKRQATQEGK